MATDAEFLAFAEYVRNVAFRIAMQAKNGHTETASADAFALCSEAAAHKRKLLGLPEPDDSVDYDEDYDLGELRKLQGESS